MKKAERIARLTGALYGFVYDGGALDNIPADVRWALNGGRLDHDAAAKALNRTADQINDSHDMECSSTIRKDDRANLFTNVAGYMLSNDTTGMEDAAIMDAAIVDSYDNGEPECEAKDCGGPLSAREETRGVRVIDWDGIPYRHTCQRDDDHDPVMTEAGQEAAQIARVREWSE